MRIFVFIAFCCLATISFSQEKKKVERLWLSANVSPSQYVEFGASVQIFEQFLLSGYYQRLARNVGPGIPKNPYAFLWTSHTYKKDEMNTGSLMIGFASPTPHSVMLSFLAGPSANRCVTHSDFSVTYGGGDYYSYPLYVSSKETTQWKIGLNFKATLSFIVQRNVCINLGLAGNHNGVDNYYRFVLGIGVGEFGSTRKEPKYKRVVLPE